MSKLIGVRRFGAGWEPIAEHPENEAIMVLRKPPAKSNVWIKTENDNGPLRAPPEPRKFDPSELDDMPPPRRAVRKPPPRVASKTVKPSPPKKAGRDPDRHREYMRQYMKKRRASKGAGAEP